MKALKLFKSNSMISNLPKLVKKFLGKLPLSDYPVLSTFRFVSFWLNFALAPSLMSMRDLFSRLNYQGIKIDISTFYQGNKMRSTEFF
jgi:putative transposase